MKSVFVTVGTQLPFARLLDWVDRWRSSVDIGISVTGQIGKPGCHDSFERSYDYMAPDFFDECLVSSDLVISHAGMGNIIKSLEAGVPIVIVPRLARWGEHRSDHQVDTAKSFDGFPSLFVANSFDDFCDVARRGLSIGRGAILAESASRRDLVSAVQQFIGGR